LATELTDRLAERRRRSRRQANGLRNQGLFVLEAFGLIEVERLPVERGGRGTSTYGCVPIIRDRMDEKEACGEEARESMGEITDAEKALLALAKAQADAMFARQEDWTAIDDSEFVPLLECVLTAFEAHGLGQAAADERWDHAFRIYDRHCREHESEDTLEEQRDEMRSYLTGPRGLHKNKGRRHR
jgi:hypothetical protein